MQYMGSKNRIAKYLLPIMLKNRNGATWVEPFVGGANMIDKVEGDRIGADINPYLIKALCLIRDNPELIPRNNKEYTEDMFNIAKAGDLNNPIDCFAMFQYTFGSKFKDSWARNKKGTDYVKGCVRNVLIQSKNIQGVTFTHSSYQDLEIPKNSIIYCDPPYANTTKYKGENFNHTKFWAWCRAKSKEGHQVFISEYNAPSDFKSIWSKKINVLLAKNPGGKKGREQLFVYCGDSKI